VLDLGKRRGKRQQLTILSGGCNNTIRSENALK
jgi:hypothetical protein